MDCDDFPERDHWRECQEAKRFPAKNNRAWFKGEPCLVADRIHEYNKPFKVRIDFYNSRTTIVEQTDLTPRD